MAFLVFLQWIQWMAGWVGVHSKGTMQQDVIYGDVRWGTAHYPSQVRLRARPLDHPLKLHSPASQTVPFTKTVRGGCYRAIYTDKPTPADDPAQMNAEHWFHHLTIRRGLRGEILFSYFSKTSLLPSVVGKTDLLVQGLDQNVWMLRACKKPHNS